MKKSELYICLGTIVGIIKLSAKNSEEFEGLNEFNQWIMKKIEEEKE